VRPTNIICRVVDIDYDHSLYELACEAGVLSILFARNAFDNVCADIDVKIRLDIKVGVREAIKNISIGGGQGMLKCNCTATCMTNRCSCNLTYISPPNREEIARTETIPTDSHIASELSEFFSEPRVFDV
jgi:hypothetical protein